MRIVLTAALFLKLWIPSGWMLDADASGFRIKPCPSGSLILPALQPPDHAGEDRFAHAAHHRGHEGHMVQQAAPAEQEHDHRVNPADQSCAFGALGMASAAFGAPHVLDPPGFDALVLPAAPSAVLAGVSAPRPPSTGPPVAA